MKRKYNSSGSQNDGADHTGAKDNSLGDRSKNTLFVRGIPPDATTADLESFFSEIGPLRSCFVVSTNPNNAAGDSSLAPHRGFGFVQFALAEDATRAVSELKGSQFMGKKPLRLEFAMRRNQEGAGGEENGTPATRRKTGTEGEKAAPTSEQKKPAKTKEQKTRKVLITGLPDGMTSKALFKKARKHGKVEGDIVFPASGSQPNAAIVSYKSNEDATKAVSHLNDHIFKGAKISAALFVQGVNLTKMISRKPRLIIRNLANSCTKDKLTEEFSKHGELSEVTIPTKEGEDGTAVSKGFAFVQFGDVKQAEEAMKALNGTNILGRTIAVDWAIPKDQYESLSQKAKQSNNEGQDADEENAEDEEAVGPQSDKQEADETLDAEDAELDDEEAVDEMGEDDDDEDEEADDDVDGEHDKTDDDDAMDVDEKDGPKKAIKEPKKSGIDSHAGTTLFIRNLSFETTQETVFERFSEFGKLRYARITVDKDTGRSRGTGFVCFFNKQDAEQCLEEYKKASDPTAALTDPTPQPESGKKNNHLPKSASQSILVREPSLNSSEHSRSFVIDGRFVNVTLAVAREDAEVLTEKRRADMRAKDTRNLYLAREGVVFPDSPEAAEMNPSELSRRHQSYTERRRLLQQNPNLRVSRTRLSVRNLDLWVTDGVLKQAGLIAVREFWNEVGKGTREPLEKDVVAEEVESKRWKEAEGRVPIGAGKMPRVVQSKILVTKDRIDSRTGLPRSKGCGFIEFASHVDALACLRYLNRNRTLFEKASNKLAAIRERTGGAKKEDENDNVKGKDDVKDSQKRSPIVEFAVEDVRKLKVREQKSREIRQRGERATRETNEEEAEVEAADRETTKEQRKPKGKFESRGLKGKRPRDDDDVPSEPRRKTQKKAEQPMKAQAYSTPHAKSETDSKRKRQKTRHLSDDFGEEFDFPEPASAPKKKTPKQTKEGKEEKKFDDIVSRYAKQFFGGSGGAGAGGKSGSDAPKADRWFTL
ncbi:hypothetical protein BJ742DRAFT_716002 [Cladochytrium replicatum]|nr:hypothetical protein BJ742DRAFT_716002 [Cladochytrium replicatum]